MRLMTLLATVLLVGQTVHPRRPVYHDPTPQVHVHQQHTHSHKK